MRYESSRMSFFYLRLFGVVIALTVGTIVAIKIIQVFTTIAHQLSNALQVVP